MSLLDLSLWQSTTWDIPTISPNIEGRWVLSGQNVVTQVENSKPSVFCGGLFPLGSSVEGTIRMLGIDDDMVGFTYGYSAKADTGDDLGFLLFDWKSDRDSNVPLPAGLFARHLEGPLSLPFAYPRSFDRENDGEGEILQRGATLDGINWLRNRDYVFRFEFGRDSLKLFVDGGADPEIELSPEQYVDGELCFYTFSQVALFSNFSVEPLVTLAPTLAPTTLAPTPVPTPSPSRLPTAKPSGIPSRPPTVAPTPVPTVMPSLLPSPEPTLVPTTDPTLAPFPLASDVPSSTPIEQPSTAPSDAPVLCPTKTMAPSPTMTNFHLWDPKTNTALTEIINFGVYNLQSFDLDQPAEINVVYDASGTFGTKSVSFNANGVCYCDDTAPFAMIEEEGLHGGSNDGRMPSWDYSVNGNAIHVGLHSRKCCQGSVLGVDFVNFDLLV